MKAQNLSIPNLYPVVNKTGQVRYRARVVRDGKTLLSRMFDDSGKAAAWRYSAQACADAGQPIPEPRATKVPTGSPYMTFSVAFGRWVESRYPAGGRLKEQTRREIMADFKAVAATFGALRLSDITYEMTQSYVHTQAATLARSTVVKRLRIIRNVFGFAQANDWVRCDPTMGLRVPGMYERAPRQTTIRPEQVLSLMASVPAKMRLAVALQAFCGLRVAEVFGIQLRDIDFTERVIALARQGGKPQADGADERGFVAYMKNANAVRTVGVPAPVWELLEWHIEHILGEEQDPEQRLMPRFHRSWGYLPYYSAVRNALLVLGELRGTGVESVTHALRKTCVTALLEAEMEPRCVSIVIGHQELVPTGASPMTINVYDQRTEVLRYAQLQAATMDEVIRKRVRGSLILPDEVGPAGWVHAEEAAARLGVSLEAVTRLGTRGVLRVVAVAEAGQRRRRKWVSRESLDTRLSNPPTHVPISDIGDAVGASEITISRTARALGIKVQVGTGVPTDAVEGLKKALAARANFEGAHTQARTLTKNWHITRERIQQLVLAGLLIPGSPPSGWSGEVDLWVTRESALSIQDSKASQRRGWLSVPEAACLMGLSAVQVRRLIRDGVLDAQRDGQLLVDPVSARRYLDRRA